MCFLTEETLRKIELSSVRETKDEGTLSEQEDRETEAKTKHKVGRRTRAHV